MDKKNHNSRATDEVADMIRGVPPRNILISFGDEPAKTLEEHIQERKHKETKSKRKRKSEPER